MKEMGLLGISDQEAANAWLPQFIRAFTGRFAMAASEPNDVHAPTRTVTIVTHSRGVTELLWRGRALTLCLQQQASKTARRGGWQAGQRQSRADAAGAENAAPSQSATFGSDPTETQPGTTPLHAGFIHTRDHLVPVPA